MSHGACVPLRVHTVVVSVQHSEKISLEDLRADVMTKVIRMVIPERYLDDKTTFHINPCGLFVVGGPQVCGCFLGPFTERTCAIMGGIFVSNGNWHTQMFLCVSLVLIRWHSQYRASNK